MGHHTDKIVHYLRGTQVVFLPKLPEATCRWQRGGVCGQATAGGG